MPLGAVLGGASLVGSVLSSSSANKNAKRAAQTSADNNAANIALQRESRDMALQRLEPYSNRGNAAGGAINALLGLGGGNNNLAGAPGQVDWGAYVRGNPDALANWDSIKGNSDGAQFGGDINAFGAYHFNKDGARRDLSAFTVGANTGGENAAQAQQAAFDRFRNSTGYQFRLNEGLDAVNSGWAGSGLLQSGAALRAINEYGQNFASNEFGNYLNALANQQAVGAGAASSSAGVSQNFANMATNSNNFNAQNQMNAQLSRQNPLANALGTVGGLGFGFLTGGR